ncbi:MAG TPA: FAD-binding protein [Verrucomicrobiae bacterium]|nr:FAD-binding protein [Verrucomicrobiae bacterium]
MTETLRPDAPHWYSKVEAPERVDDVAGVAWHSQADLVVVGYGGAGVAAALEAREAGLEVIALDLATGGGSTAINGGVVYAGGGTAIQKQAGVEDSCEAMFQYLRGETQGVVSDATLRRFCEQSAAMLDWMSARGVKFDATRYDPKTSYPPPGYHLYHSDSSLAARRAAIARPAPRGHKVFTPPSRAALGFGAHITNPLAAAAAKVGVRLETCAEARRLVVDPSGRVVGVCARVFEDDALRARYAALQAQATKYTIMLPPAFPGAQFTLAIAGWYRRRAEALEHRRVLRRIRAKKGVCLSAGGFVFNDAMVKHYAAKYAMGMPLGNPGDNGSGIRLGQSVGGVAERLSHMSAWRFIRPPAGLTWGAIVDGRGERFIDETVYGAAIGYEMIEHHDGRAYVVMDQAIFAQTLEQLKSKELYSFQSGPAFLALKFARTKAATLKALAEACGFEPQTFARGIAAYNEAAHGRAEDAFGKAKHDLKPIVQGPFYAIDIGVGSKLFPLPVLSLGGLAVDEDTGAVLDASRKPIAGLYAAGRNALGICSHLYVSGLSVSDCIFSGRRAAQALARG